LPHENLFLENIENQDLIDRNIGDVVDLTCSLGISKPRPRLTWFVNDQKVKTNQMSKHSSAVFKNNPLNNRLRLKFKLSNEHFHNGHLNLKCTASLILAYQFDAVHYVNNEITLNQSHRIDNSKNHA